MLRFRLNRHPLLYQVRYALVLRLGPEEIFRRVEPIRRSRVPRAYADRVRDFDAQAGSFAAARRIAHALSAGHPRGPGMGVDSVRALAAILAGGRGVCSDYTQVFLGLCTAAGVAAREWGICAGFDASGVGHTVTEVYATEHGKWVTIDPFFSLYPTRREDALPLSVVELAELAAADRTGEVRLVDIDPEGGAGERRERWIERYLRPEHHFFLLVGNDVFRQDRFLRLVGKLPIPAVHLLMLLSGNYPRFHLYLPEASRERTEKEVRRLRRRLAGVGLAAALVVVLTVAGLWGILRATT